MTENEFLDKIEQIMPEMTHKYDGDGFGAYWAWYEYDKDSLYVRIDDKHEDVIIKKNGTHITMPDRIKALILLRHKKYMNNLEIKGMELKNEVFLQQISSWE